MLVSSLWVSGVPATIPAFESDLLGLIGWKRELQKHETRITAGFASVNGH